MRFRIPLKKAEKSTEPSDIQVKEPITRRIIYILSFLPTYIHNEISELGKRGILVDIMMPEESSEEDLWRFITNEENTTHNNVVIHRVVPFRWLINSIIRIFSSPFSVLLPFIIHHPIRFVVTGFFAYRYGCLKYFMTGAFIASTVEKSEPERIHVHFAKDSAHIGLWAARLLKIPFSLTTHANDIFVNPDMERLNFLFQQADGIHTISFYNRKYLGNIFGKEIEEKISVIHLGIDLESGSFPERKKKKTGRKTIVSIGSGLVEKKGIPYLIEACRILHNRGHKLKCLIIGSDRSGDVLSRMKILVDSIELSGIVELHGAVTSEEALRTVSRANVFVLPSIEALNGDKDGIPVSLMEALGIGIPCISTCVSGIPELIEDGVNGLLVPQRDSEALADAIEKIFQDSAFSDKLAEKGRKTIREKFSLQGYVDKLLKFWESISCQDNPESRP